ncbi:Plasma membrane sulfite pump involved in sulfite metabolism [Diplodia seriata]|uniref:Plasma membrane sulfite pump involved in sulfite metabolism n=1 Tax=Diplodia seriata TaxID=420778 RepID=A0ABR3CF90_9PEZI
MDPSVEPGCNDAETHRPCPNAKYQRGWRKIVRNFTPSWFSVNMGTGIVSILLHNLPYNGAWLYWISVALFAVNVLLFVVFLAISTLRYVLYPSIWIAMINHPAQSLFLGTFPMGLATIINMTVFVCVPAWGDGAARLAWGLWWIDAALSLATCMYLPFAIMSLHGGTELRTMTAAWLLPIVSPIVAAATGGIVAEALPDAHHAATTVVASYVLWGTGVPLALVVLVIYFHRLTIHKLPAREVIVSVFLPLGPLGQGGFAIMQLGKVARAVFPVTGTLGGEAAGDKALSLASTAGDVLYVAGWLLAVVMWGFGLVWLFFALATISRCARFPFNMGWWGFTFPLGVFTVSTVTIGKELPSPFFTVLGTVLSVVVTLLWMGVALGTVRRAWSGEIFFSPCVKSLDEKTALMQGGAEGIEMGRCRQGFHVASR